MTTSLWNTMTGHWIASGPAAVLATLASWRSDSRTCQPVRQGGITILLVDDDTLVRDTMAEALAEMGHRLIVCASGDECLAALPALRGAAVLVTDVAMPGMSGLTLATAFRRARPGSTVVFATGLAETEELTSALGPGDLLLAKPFCGSELLSIVCQAATLADDLTGLCSRSGFRQ